MCFYDTQLKKCNLCTNRKIVLAFGSEIGDYWDHHDLADVWEHTEAVEFEVNVQSERIYFPIDRELSNKIAKIAKLHGVTPETLVNLWIQEKANQLNDSIS